MNDRHPTPPGRSLKVPGDVFIFTKIIYIMAGSIFFSNKLSGSKKRLHIVRFVQ